MYECKICGWKTKYIVSVKDHVRIHMNEKPFICGVCTKAFSNQSNLNSHLARHYDNRPFECDVCNLTFKLKSSLNSHKKRHYQEKRFTCDICGKKVFTGSALKQHRFSHTDERPFHCEVCNKSFKTGPLLTRHAYIHTGGGKYQCYICKEAFARKEYWRIHMRKRHNQDMEHDKRFRLQQNDVSQNVECDMETDVSEVQVAVSEVQAVVAKDDCEAHEVQAQTFTVEYEHGQEIHIQEGEFNVITGETGEAQIAIGEEIVGVIAGDEELSAIGADGNVQSLDKDTQAQVEYLVNLQYEYVK